MCQIRHPLIGKYMHCYCLWHQYPRLLWRKSVEHELMKSVAIKPREVHLNINRNSRPIGQVHFPVYPTWLVGFHSREEGEHAVSILGYPKDAPAEAAPSGGLQMLQMDEVDMSEYDSKYHSQLVDMSHKKGLISIAAPNAGSKFVIMPSSKDPRGVSLPQLTSMAEEIQEHMDTFRLPVEVVTPMLQHQALVLTFAREEDVYAMLANMPRSIPLPFLYAVV